MTKSKNTKIMNIYGTTRYVYLSSPDTKWDPKGKYHITLEVDKDKAQEARKAIDDIIGKEVADEHIANPNGKPVERGALQYGIEDKIITFKAQTKFKPEIVDRRNKPIDPEVSIWGGTTLWADIKLEGYNTNNKIGCKVYLIGVQIDDLVKGSGNGVSRFPDRGEKPSVLPEHKEPPKELY